MLGSYQSTYAGKLEIPAGKSNGTRKSVWEASESMWGRGEGDWPEHLEMWLIKNTGPTPSLRHKND